jgi:hypothetical protein
VDLIKRAGDMGLVRLVVLRRGGEVPPPAAANGCGSAGAPSSAASSTNAANTPPQPPAPYDVRLQKAASEDFGCTIVTKQHRYIGKGLEI